MRNRIIFLLIMTLVLESILGVNNLSAKDNSYFVNSTKKPATATVINAQNGGLTVNGKTTKLVSNYKLADSNATKEAQTMYRYLKAVGESEAVIYGHMEDTVLKAGGSDLSESDTKDLTGSISGVVGFDTGNMFSGYANKYNNRHSGANISNNITGNIKAAALFSNEAIQEGAVITVSCHMNNFAYASKKSGWYEKSYEQYNFGDKSCYELSGDCMNNLLSGKKYNAVFNAYLDFIADYAKQVNGTIIFRPFHENTGSWFWWGKDFCSASTYKAVFQYTVKYLTQTKNVHNMLFAYSPGTESQNVNEFAERYPGDDYVDLIGFDTYDNEVMNNNNEYYFLNRLASYMDMVSGFAKSHNKLFALTETGMAYNNEGMPESGNKRKNWFGDVLQVALANGRNCCYFMTWTNRTADGEYYQPFVKWKNANGSFYGHEMMDNFIDFYNQKTTIFAKQQQGIVDKIIKGDVPPTTEPTTTKVIGTEMSTTPKVTTGDNKPSVFIAELTPGNNSVNLDYSNYNYSFHPEDKVEITVNFESNSSFQGSIGTNTLPDGAWASMGFAIANNKATIKWTCEPVSFFMNVSVWNTTETVWITSVEVKLIEPHMQITATEQKTTVSPKTTAKQTTTSVVKSDITTKTYVDKVKIKKASKNNNSKKIKIIFQKIKKAKGYQIKASTSKKFKSRTVTQLVKKSKAVIKHSRFLRKNKIYVKVRAYVTVKKSKVYGAWSKVKKVKVLSAH